jgi:hypothetical protein
VKESPWVAFWLPIAVFAIVLVIIFGLGFILLSIAYATEHSIPGLHSGGVIIAALILSTIIMGGAAWYSTRPAPRAPSSHQGDH